MVQPPLKAGPASKLEQTCIHIEILIMLSRHLEIQLMYMGFFLVGGKISESS